MASFRLLPNIFMTVTHMKGDTASEPSYASGVELHTKALRMPCDVYEV